MPRPVSEADDRHGRDDQSDSGGDRDDSGAASESDDLVTADGKEAEVDIAGAGSGTEAKTDVLAKAESPDGLDSEMSTGGDSAEERDTNDLPQQADLQSTTILSDEPGQKPADVDSQKPDVLGEAPPTADTDPEDRDPDTPTPDDEASASTPPVVATPDDRQIGTGSTDDPRGAGDNDHDLKEATGGTSGGEAKPPAANVSEPAGQTHGAPTGDPDRDDTRSRVEASVRVPDGLSAVTPTGAVVAILLGLLLVGFTIVATALGESRPPHVLSTPYSRASASMWPMTLSSIWGPLIPVVLGVAASIALLRRKRWQNPVVRLGLTCGVAMGVAGLTLAWALAWLGLVPLRLLSGLAVTSVVGSLAIAVGLTVLVRRIWDVATVRKRQWSDMPRQARVPASVLMMSAALYVVSPIEVRTNASIRWAVFVPFGTEGSQLGYGLALAGLWLALLTMLARRFDARLQAAILTGWWASTLIPAATSLQNLGTYFPAGVGVGPWVGLILAAGVTGLAGWWVRHPAALEGLNRNADTLAPRTRQTTNPSADDHPRLSIGRRAGAAVVDTILFVVTVSVLGLVTDWDESLAGILPVIGLLPQAVIVSVNGRSLGHRIVRGRPVDVSGTSRLPSLGRRLGRIVVATAAPLFVWEILIGPATDVSATPGWLMIAAASAISVVPALARKDGRALHDLASGTRVVKDV